MPNRDWMWLRYGRAVFSHGLGLWTGAAVTSSAWLLDKAVNAGWLGKADWWLHPSPAFYIVVIAFGLGVAQYMTWKQAEEERRSLQERREALESKVDRLEEELNRLQSEGIKSIARAIKSPRPSMAKQFLEDIERWTPKFEVEASLDDLTHAWQLEGLIPASLIDLRFVVLNVKNTTVRNFPGIVVSCKAGETGIRCVWSHESGGRFIPGGRHAAELNAGDSRLLVIAQGVFDNPPLWLRLTPWAPVPELVAKVTSPTEGVRYASASTGEILNLGQEITLDLVFTAEGFSEEYRLLLGFDESGEPSLSLRRTRP